jgi:thymidine kinase
MEYHLIRGYQRTGKTRELLSLLTTYTGKGKRVLVLTDTFNEFTDSVDLTDLCTLVKVAPKNFDCLLSQVAFFSSAMENTFCRAEVVLIDPSCVLLEGSDKFLAEIPAFFPMADTIFITGLDIESTEEVDYTHIFNSVKVRFEVAQ